MDKDLWTCYQEQKDKVKVVRCDYCNEEFLWLGVNIEKLVIDDSKHNLHFVYSYFKCPKCGQPYTVCIDNNETALMEHKFLLSKKKYNKKLRKGTVTQEDIEKLEKRQRALSRKREKLINLYGMAFTEIAKKKLGEDKQNQSTVADNTEKEEVK